MQTPKFVDINGHKALQWQAKFVKAFSNKVHREDGSTNFLLCAAPNSGKTRAAGFAMMTAAAKFQIDLIVVAVPNCAIQRQWAAEVAPYGIALSTEISNARLIKRCGLDSALDGLVVTYAQVARNPELFRKMCHDRPSMACLDEVHHLLDHPANRRSVLQTHGLLDSVEPETHESCSLVLRAPNRAALESHLDHVGHRPLPASSWSLRPLRGHHASDSSRPDSEGWSVHPSSP